MVNKEYYDITAQFILKNHMILDAHPILYNSIAAELGNFVQVAISIDSNARTIKLSGIIPNITDIYNYINSALFDVYNSLEYQDFSKEVLSEYDYRDLVSSLAGFGMSMISTSYKIDILKDPSSVTLQQVIITL